MVRAGENFKRRECMTGSSPMTARYGRVCLEKIQQHMFSNCLLLWCSPSNSNPAQQPHWGTGSLVQPQGLFPTKSGSKDTM